VVCKLSLTEIKHIFKEDETMLQISEIVRKTEEMFDLFNEHFYEGELSRPAITVSPDGGRGAYGWCSINEIWNASGAKYREINLCAEYLDRPIFELAATLLHEMAHLYNLVHGIQDVSNNGYYHNQKFKATAETHGLHIEKHAKYGWTVTTLAPEAEAWIREILGEDKINASRLPVEGTTKGGSKKSINRSIKYVCPCCGTIIRATREVNVICGDCGEAFERE
jgi:rubrerythrin